MPKPLTTAAAPRPSATVVVVRPGKAAPEVLMVQRHSQAAFGSAYAFPGGVLEPADSNVSAYCTGLSAAAACRVLDVESGGLDYYSAAIRELFEETGILLATLHSQLPDLQEARDALNAGSLAWDDFVAGAGLGLRCDELHYFGFWITPEGAPKRFSARFFLAQMPPDQLARHCGGELVDSRWLPARAVLEAREAREIKLVYPTRKTLESVAQFDALAPLLEWARGCATRGVVCDQPTLAPGMLE
jgi:8-oxo-dGTP pyrophosphatase MutT (NUDIX family)